MNEHAGPACALSVLIVGIFAVLLHERDQPPPPAKSVTRNVNDVKVGRPDPAESGLAPSPIRETALVTTPPPPAKTKEEPTSISGRDAEPSKGLSSPVRSASEGRGRLPRGDAPVARRAVPRPRPIGARSPFTVVEPGETLADVATRVYGSPDAKEAVWKANRDQIARIDSPLARGMLLRTP